MTTATMTLRMEISSEEEENENCSLCYEQLMNEKQSEDKLPRDPFVIHCSQFSTVMD